MPKESRKPLTKKKKSRFLHDDVEVVRSTKKHPRGRQRRDRPKLDPNDPHRSWVLTLWPTAEDQWDSLKNMLQDMSSKILMGRETCPSTMKVHCQAAIVLKTPLRRTGLTTKLVELNSCFKGTHLEPMAGSWESNIAYCTKEKLFYMTPEVKSAVVRRNEAFEEFSRTGNAQVVLAEMGHRWCVLNAQRLETSRSMYHGLFSTKRTEAPVVVWLYGLTGTRKTTFAMNYIKDLKDESPDDTRTAKSPFMSPPASSVKDSRVWWTGLSDQRVAVLDDLRPESFPHSLFLRLADRTECVVEIKGASVSFISSVLFVTTPEPPWRFWQWLPETETQQICRRITMVIECTKKSQSTSSWSTATPVQDTVALSLGSHGFVRSVSSESCAEMQKWRNFIGQMKREVNEVYERKCVWFARLESVNVEERERLKRFCNYNYTD
ncbi:MAG: helicase [Cressdnaviricota sp.]|nr:MAG: helicase [Cressdnaviricota sp.]